MPSPSDLTNLFAWYDADLGRYDATVGGSSVTTDRGAIARWEDQSGNGRHLTQSTSGNRPVYDATKGLVVSEMPNPHAMACPASYTLDRRDFSIFFVCELSSLRRPMNGTGLTTYHFFSRATSEALNLHYDGSNGSAFGLLSGYDGAFHPSTTTPLTTRRCLVGFVGTSGGLKCYLDGSYTTATALTAGTGTLLELLGYTGGPYPSQAGFKDAIVYNRALSDSEVTNTILAYAQSRGVASSRSHQVVFEGDSITHGYGTTVNRNWPSRLSGVGTGVRFRVTAESGITLASLSSQAASRIDPLLVGGQTNVLTAFATTNDIVFTGITGATALTNYWNYCDARRTAGWKVVAFTCLPRTDMDATQETYRQTFNAGVVANWASHADALVDVAADTRLDDATDLTYFNADGVHPTDAGAQVIAELSDPTIAALLSDLTVPQFPAVLCPQPDRTVPVGIPY